MANEQLPTISHPGDPNRCQGVTRYGQCTHLKHEGSDFCLSCRPAQRKQMGSGLRQYFLDKAQERARLAEFSDHEEIKSLREEIALMRMMIERRWNLISNDAEFINAEPMLDRHIKTVEKLVKSCNQLEQNLGTLLTKPTLIRVGQQVCEVIAKRLEGLPNYEQIVDVIIADVVNTIVMANNEPMAVQSQQAPTQT